MDINQKIKTLSFVEEIDSVNLPGYVINFDYDVVDGFEGRIQEIFECLFRNDFLPDNYKVLIGGEYVTPFFSALMTFKDPEIAKVRNDILKLSSSDCDLLREIAQETRNPHRHGTYQKSDKAIKEDLSEILFRALKNAYFAKTSKTLELTFVEFLKAFKYSEKNALEEKIKTLETQLEAQQASNIDANIIAQTEAEINNLRRLKEEAEQRAIEERANKELAVKRAEVERAGKEKAEQEAESERSKKEEAERKAKAERAKKEEAEREAEVERLKKEKAQRKLSLEKKKTSEVENEIEEEQKRQEALSKEQKELQKEQFRIKVEKDKQTKRIREGYLNLIPTFLTNYQENDYSPKNYQKLNSIIDSYKGKTGLIFSQEDSDALVKKLLSDLNSTPTLKKQKRIKIALIVASSVCVFGLAGALIGIGVSNSIEQKEKGQKYTDANALMVSGSYEDALNYYKSLGNYEDSANKVKVCEGLIQLSDSTKSKEQKDVVNGIKSIVSGGQSVGVTYSSSEGFPIRKSLMRKNANDNTFYQLIDSTTFELYKPKGKTGYSFDGWFSTHVDYSDIVHLSLDSKWSLEQYSITYILDGGTNSTSNPTTYSVESDDVVLEPAKKDNYTFKGWYLDLNDDEPISEIEHGSNGNLKLYARFEINHYKVNFYNWDDSLLCSTTVDHGSAAEYFGDTPKKAADQQSTYSFKGWDKSLLNITEDTDFIAQFEGVKSQYTITFKNYDGEVLDTCTVEYGDTAFYSGKTPTKPNSDDDNYCYVFTGWNKTLDDVKNSYDVQAQFEEHNRYVVNFYNGSKLLLSTKVNDGDIPVYDGDTPLKDSTQQYNYTFAGWEPSLAAIDDNTDYYATFNSNLNKYTVTFKNYDGTVLDTDTVDYGSAANYGGETPEKPSDQQYSYTFSGWDIILDEITENVDAIAQFDNTLNKYTVTFKNYDGTVLGTDTVDYGSSASYTGDTPAKPSTQQYSYVFSGWDINLSSITEDVVATAQFNSTLNKYTVTFKNYDGTVLGSDTVDYGSSASYTGDTPTKPDETGDRGYQFTGWSASLNNVQGNFEVTAQYVLYLKNAEFNLNSEENGYILTRYYGASQLVTIPATHNGLPIVEIGSGAFSSTNGCGSVEVIDIPNSVTTFKSGAFNISSLEKLNISSSSSLTTIESNAITFSYHSYTAQHYTYLQQPDSSDESDLYLLVLKTIFPEGVDIQADGLVVEKLDMFDLKTTKCTTLSTAGGYYDITLLSYGNGVSKHVVPNFTTLYSGIKCSRILSYDKEEVFDDFYHDPYNHQTKTAWTAIYDAQYLKSDMWYSDSSNNLRVSQFYYLGSYIRNVSFIEETN